MFLECLGGLACCGYLFYKNNQDWFEERKVKKIINKTWFEIVSKSTGENSLAGFTIEKIDVTENVIELIVKIPLGKSFEVIEANKEIFRDNFKCVCEAENIRFSDKCILKIIVKHITDLDYRFVELSPYQLLCGYNYKAENIIVDMKITTHLLVTGLGGNGKTGMLRVMAKNIIENNKADIMLLNGFIDDYEDLNINHIRNHDDIKNYIQSLLEDVENEISRDRPLYILFEELGKVKDKDLIALTTKLLQYGRHNNIFVVGIIQIATKEELKFKDLFNARLSFKQIEESAYRVALGVNVPEFLCKREFYLFSDNVYKGRTYNLNW